MQISNIHSGTGVNNVIPGEMNVLFNFRYSTESTLESLKSRTMKILEKYDFKYQIDWSLSGEPFITEGGWAEVAIVPLYFFVVSRYLCTPVSIAARDPFISAAPLPYRVSPLTTGSKGSVCHSPSVPGSPSGFWQRSGRQWIHHGHAVRRR